MAGAGSFRKTEVRKAGEAGVGREVGNGARGGSGLRSSATDTMAVRVQETQWRCLAYSSLRLQLQLVDEGGARDGRPGEEAGTRVMKSDSLQPQRAAETDN